MPEVFPAGCDGDFEMGLRLPLSPAFGVSVPCLVVEGSLEHVFKDHAVVLNVRMSAHPSSVVLAATGCAGCAIYAGQWTHLRRFSPYTSPKQTSSL